MLLGLIGVLLGAAGLAAADIDFARDVQPILRRNCYACHGPAMQQSGLRFDDAAAALKGGYSGAAIVPGKSAESPMMLRIQAAKGMPQMPPGPKKLDAAQAQILATWIDQGAKFPAGFSAVARAGAAKSKHWAFQPIVKPAVPDGKQPVDYFVRARLEREKIAPAAEADKRTLLRRLSFDLTGLPPAPEEMAAYTADARADAYDRQVERLLASPHFGEKWARHWLDQARYADSDGYEKDWVRPYAWRWRNWVIDSINRDQPFDQFTIEQIAGDLLPNASTEQRVATGFHRNTLTNREGGIDDRQFEFEIKLDRASTVATTWLGLTAGCAQCHDHKYDPISQKDFYALYAFFDNAEEVDIDAPLAGEVGPWLRTHDEYRRKREALLAEYGVAALQADWEKNILYTIAHPGERTDWDLAWDCVNKLTEGGDGAKIVRIAPEKRTARERDILIDHFVGNYHFAVGNKKWKELKLDVLQKKLRELKAAYPQLTQAMTLLERREAGPSHLRVRGDYKALGIEVQPDVLSALPPLQASAGVARSGARLSGYAQGVGGATVGAGAGLDSEGRATRLDLARWLVREDNPLTARVAVNRVWQELFGAGLVRTPEDFGVRSEAPVHPELLDWLAADFRESKWSRKALLRRIVTSATYKQSSAARAELKDIDPNNTLLARQNRLRLSGEAIRDAALAASGLLTRQVGGPSVFPPIPAGVMELSYASRGWGQSWMESTGADRYRRGLYIQFLRTTPYPLLVNFDVPKATVAVCKRDRSNTPLQALNLLNDPVFLETAQALAVRVVSEAPAEFRGRLNAAFQFALGRQANEAEYTRLQTYFEKQEAAFAKDEVNAAKLAPAALAGSTRAQVAAWTALASVVLNLDEFITRE
jgi:mono/diheme cytochrome c family protein